jgi:hypothetical protein
LLRGSVSKNQFAKAHHASAFVMLAWRRLGNGKAITLPITARLGQLALSVYDWVGLNANGWHEATQGDPG